MNRRRTILLADDDENDVTLLKLAYARSRLVNPLVIVNDGVRAIEYLDGEGSFANRLASPLPCLVLLDLKMPRRNGFEVLSWIRAHPDLRRLIVVVLTTSQHGSDIERAYDLGANSYAVKPGSFGGLVDV